MELKNQSSIILLWLSPQQTKGLLVRSLSQSGCYKRDLKPGPDACFVLYCILFVHFYSAFNSQPELFRSAPDHSNWHCVGVYTPKRYRQLQVKDLPKVPTWRLDRDSNPRPSGRKASTLPMRHHAKHSSFNSAYSEFLYLRSKIIETIFTVYAERFEIFKCDASTYYFAGVVILFLQFYVIFAYEVHGNDEVQ